MHSAMREVDLISIIFFYLDMPESYTPPTTFTVNTEAGTYCALSLKSCLNFAVIMQETSCMALFIHQRI